jgi:hypothetical protein
MDESESNFLKKINTDSSGAEPVLFLGNAKFLVL